MLRSLICNPFSNYISPLCSQFETFETFEKMNQSICKFVILCAFTLYLIFYFPFPSEGTMTKHKKVGNNGKKKLSSAQYQRVRREMKKRENNNERKRRSRAGLKALNEQKVREAAKKK